MGDRKVIMNHLRECLSEGEGSKWRRVLGALMIVEHLLEKGSPALISEASEGRHFDLGMRLGFLERFEYTIDERVQGMVQQKAYVLRDLFIRKIEGVPLSIEHTQKGKLRNAHVITQSGVTVVARHTDDTDSESEEDFPKRHLDFK